MAHAAYVSVTYAPHAHLNPLNSRRWQDRSAFPTHHSSPATQHRSFLIGSAAIRNGHNSHENSAITFSNRSKIAYFHTRFARHDSPIPTRKSRVRGSQVAASPSPLTRPIPSATSFLIATEILEINGTCSKQTRNDFLIATFSRVLRVPPARCALQEMRRPARVSRTAPTLVRELFAWEWLRVFCSVQLPDDLAHYGSPHVGVASGEIQAAD
jgi:hypothetical protein